MSKKTTSSKIKFEYNGQQYTLEFTADSIKRMERSGFKFGKIDEQILTAPEELFSGLFLANHANVPRKKRIEIYNELCGDSEDGTTSLNDAIFEMLTEAIDAFTNSHQGNVAWRME